MIHIIYKFSIIITGAQVCLSACVPHNANFASSAQKRGNDMCAGLFDTRAIQALGDKMPIFPGGVPSREMLMINQVPIESEIDAIRALESAIRTCRRMRTVGGVPTSASEDILEQRISQLRYQLYSGSIPYGVYNYGLAKALKEQAQFMSATDGVFAESAAGNPTITMAVPMDDGADWDCSEMGQTISCR